jgi:hypothetical protein
MPLISDSKLLPSQPTILDADREILRALAGQVTELAARPIEAEKRQLWIDHNALRPTRPVIFCDPENSWHEIIPQNALQCESDLARSWEWSLRREIWWATQMNDDRTTSATFDISHVRTEWDWGVHETKIGGQDGGSYVWDSPIKNEADLAKLHHPTLQIDFAATDRLAKLANETFGDLLPVRVKISWWWTLGMTWTLANLRGLEQIMLDMIDTPDLIHRLMKHLSDGTLALISELEEKGLLYTNADGAYVGSGGLGWSDEIPLTPNPSPKGGGEFPPSPFGRGAGGEGFVRLQNMWGFAESQETTTISPRMFAEFIFPYQLPLLEKFGLNCYGCCEPLDKRWHIVKQIPRLRRVSMSPWANYEKMAEQLGTDYIFSMKPNPADLAMETFDEEYLRSVIHRDLVATRNCRVEVIMKDNHTIRNDPRRVIRWVRLMREEIEKI